MPDNNTDDFHSDEIQEIMGSVPSVIVTWGMSIIFMVLVILIIGSYFFKYPVVVKVPSIITTYQTPVVLEARINGKIEQILINDKDTVSKGDLIAVIKGTANFKKILAVENQIKQVQLFNTMDSSLNSSLLYNFDSLGELQYAYSKLKKTIREYNHFLEQEHIPKKIKNLELQLIKHKEVRDIQSMQHKLIHEEVELSKKAFERDSTLFAMSAYMISQAEYEKSKQLYTQKIAKVVSFEVKLKNNDITLLNIEDNLLNLKIEQEKLMKEQKWSIEEQKESLLAEIQEWKLNYLITSPIDGVASQTNMWSENQSVKIGDRVSTVIPYNESKIIVKVIIPNEKIGNIKIGQSVFIKLEGFPYMEFGMLEGYLSRISLVPEKNSYIGMVQLNEGMCTTYDKRLKFIQEMEGVAEIVTKDSRAIERFILPLRNFL